MGYSKWSNATYSTIKRDTSTKSRAAIFTNSSLNRDMDPKGLRVRECRDSLAHPVTLAIKIWLDVTGSMGSIPEKLVKEKLGSLIETLLKHGITDPSVLFGGIGDHTCDRSPLQVGQFESGTEELNKWLTSVYLEGGGGGQNMESYLLAWLIAGRHTSVDCYEKRSKKGYLFTIGDEKTWPSLDGSKIVDLIGGQAEFDLTAEQLLKEAQRMYHVYHIHVNSTQYKNDSNVIGDWKRLLGERLIVLDDEDNIAEVIATTIAIMEGVDKTAVLAGFDDTTALSVSNALVNIKSEIEIADSVINF